MKRPGTQAGENRGTRRSPRYGCGRGAPGSNARPCAWVVCLPPAPRARHVDRTWSLLSRISLFSLPLACASTGPKTHVLTGLRRAARHRQRHLPWCPWSGLGLLPPAAPVGIALPIALAARRKPKQRKGTHQGLNTGVSFCTDPPTWSRTSPSARIAKLSECLQSVVCGRCFRYAATFGWLRTASTDATRRSHLAAFSAAATDALSSKYSSTNT